MKDINELFWNASLEEIMQGYIYDESSEQYVCLICGKGFIKGVIYPKGDMLLEAHRAVKVHISDEHNSMFEYLLNMDKKLTGLTDLQKNLLDLFYNGYSDSEIVSKIDGGSTSTIRNHRFALRQREKQAKIFLSLMGLLEKNKTGKKQEFISIPRKAAMVDERFAITEEENEKTIKAYFKEGPGGSLSDFPTKEKRKITILNHLTKRFDTGRKYTEKEVNEILKAAYPDYVTLRRYMIEYGFLDRLKDCSYYWVKI